MSETRYYHLELGLLRVGEAYRVELSHQDPTSQARVAPLRGPCALDPAALLSLQADPAAYGETLASQVFADGAVKARFVEVQRAAEASGASLRLSIAIDPSAQELQALRWELLRHPVSGAGLATSERVLLSRFMVSRDWRPVQLRARAELVALIAVSAPEGAVFARTRLAPVDAAGEITRARAALQGVVVRTIGGPGQPLTLDRLIEGLRGGVDLLYLVSHGSFRKSTGEAVLFLQNDAGDVSPTNGESVAARLEELEKGPRLVVLASCQSAGDGQAPSNGVQSALATHLADAGVPAVIAMQGNISMVTVERLMPTLFRELLVDGRVDRALSVARGQVRARDDAWMPALFTRLKESQLWYTAGFRGSKEQGGRDVWRRLLPPIRAGKLVPILGPGLLSSLYGPTVQIARELASNSGFPLATNDWEDLPRVNQFLSVRESRFNLLATYQDRLLAGLIKRHRAWLPPEELPPLGKPKLGKLISLVAAHQREAHGDDPHSLLAALDAPVYLTTTPDPLMARALKEAGRDPQLLLTRWRHKRAPVAPEPNELREPSRQQPVVYHAFGAFGPKTEDSLVLTEDDYFDYLIGTSAGKLIPKVIESALVNNSLLFLGFKLTDWTFRVLFRLMMSLEGRELLKNYCHVAVQLDPEMQEMKDLDGAKVYLAEYFGQESNIDIFWGSAEEFLVNLREELTRAEELSGVPTAPTADKEDDEWDF